MPKFKPKKILSRVVLGRSRKKEDGINHLCLGFGPLLEQHSHAYNGNIDDNADEGSSIVSFSTTATANDLPGTGRFIDTYILQPMGRRIERLAMRLTISSLHPARIAQYIEADWTDFEPDIKLSNLHDVIADICDWRQNGSTVVAGMKELVKQTQSNSINRSAVALAALIRVSLSTARREIYDNVSRIEPIFHLEILAGSLDCSHPEKLFFVLLVKLARATLTAIREAGDLDEEVFDPFHDCASLQLTPLLRQASELRQRLRRVLNMYKFSGCAALDTMLGEACDICAVAISTIIHPRAQPEGDAHMHILETVYLIVIFILRSINELAGYTTVSGNKTNSMVLRTLAYWIDMIVYQCLDATCGGEYYFNINALHAGIMFRSLVIVGRPLSPESLQFTDENTIFAMTWLPRKQQASVDRAEDDPVLHSLVDTSIRRTRRLLLSFSELEREAQGSSSHVNGFSQLKIRANSLSFFLHEYGESWWDSWEDTLGQAWTVQVPDNELTREFREARRIGLEESSDPDDWRFGGLYQDERNWGNYALRKIARHQMGQYFRSNLDWDWDLGTCMNRLFKVEQTQERPSPVTHIPPTASPAIDMGSAPGETWKISAEQTLGVLPKEVQIAYETESGETQYMSFVPALPGPGCRPGSETANVGSFGEEESYPKPDSRHGKGSSGGEEEGENLMDGSSSSEASQPETRGDALFEKSKDDCVGKERAFDVGFDEVRVEGDVISICSLD